MGVSVYFGPICLEHNGDNDSDNEDNARKVGVPAD
jgi:hypothetical protein